MASPAVRMALVDVSRWPLTAIASAPAAHRAVAVLEHDDEAGPGDRDGAREELGLLQPGPQRGVGREGRLLDRRDLARDGLPLSGEGLGRPGALLDLAHERLERGRAAVGRAQLQHRDHRRGTQEHREDGGGHRPARADGGGLAPAALRGHRVVQLQGVARDRGEQAHRRVDGAPDPASAHGRPPPAAATARRSARARASSCAASRR